MTIDIETFLTYCDDNLKTSPSTIFEIGALNAADSVKMKNKYVNADVHAFEAHPSCYSKYKDFAFENGIYYHNIGMWFEETEIEYHDKGIDTGISSFRDRGQEYGTNKFVIKTQTPHDFCIKNKISNIDILKLDVEGCSYEILNGFKSMLSNIKIMHIETEQQQHFAGQYVEKDVFKLLTDNNFIMLKHSWCCFSQYDSIWLKK